MTRSESTFAEADAGTEVVRGGTIDLVFSYGEAQARVIAGIARRVWRGELSSAFEVRVPPRRNEFDS